MIPPEFAGRIKFEGQLVQHGLMETRAAARAIMGIDNTLRYFIAIEDPFLGSIEFPFPIQTREGSWEALIPETFLKWLEAGAALVATAYFTSAASKIAENDVKDATLASIMKKALHGMQEFVRVGKHLGHLRISKVKGLKWDREGMVGLPNGNGDYVYISHEHWKKFAQCPPDVMSDLASVIEEGRTLVIEVVDQPKRESVTKGERAIFYYEEEDTDEVVLPQYTHDLPVEIDGIVTRENGRTKTLGFFHEGHILTCMPASNDMIPYKKHLYLRCRMKGRVTRMDIKTGKPTEKRPKIVFEELQILSDDESFLPGLE